MLAVAIVQVRGPPCSVPLSPELLENLQWRCFLLALLFPMPYSLALWSAFDKRIFIKRRYEKEVCSQILEPACSAPDLSAKPGSVGWRSISST